MKKYLTLATVIFSLMYFVTSVSADCVGQYGQYGTPCNSYTIIVDKMVAKPGTNDYVDNLSVTDPRFKPSQEVMFKIKIKNTSTTKLVGMEVKDTLPAYVDAVEGPGTYNSANREITFNAGDFEVDEEKTFYLKTKVFTQASLPADKGLFCVTNFVKASSSNAYDDDTAQLCIEKQVTAAVKVPSAGPEMGLALMAIQLAGVGVGLYLKKRA
ncbi:MAG: hypothetical protein UR68_C0033G0014 [Candidatus Roizmanbacteria bacterium GW2011_GWA2_35_19]|uniref:DUF11 domain-containing protein n=1 Tax=Candidatus Roizmanbacteria bacterium GW2011_GWA2_35_19 TaxID=1618478 RepID=A0A0G0EWP2_9BACT|nr:MAG: hypothetical protein UR68_C0033G0014 [Candidatus Roizmanbacteria bacterium GW2011_GWA2_35_19]